MPAPPSPILAPQFAVAIGDLLADAFQTAVPTLYSPVVARPRRLATPRPPVGSEAGHEYSRSRLELE